MRCSILATFTVLALGTCAQAQDRTAMIRGLLTHVPTSFLGPVDERWDIDFGDLRAAAVAVSAPPKGTDDLFMTDLAPFFRARLPQLSEFVSSETVGEWPGLVGFNPAQIIAAISVQRLPHTALVLQLDPGTATAAQPVLLANGYAQTDQRGYPALFRGEDDAMFDPAQRSIADPFGARMGMSSRIAMQGDVLLQSRSWPVLTDMMQPSGPMLSDNPELRALLDALDAAPADLGGLVQVKLLTDPFGLINPLAGIDVFEPLEDGDTLPIPPQSDLPFWSMGLIADLATANTETAVIALVYPTQSLADNAAAVLQDAWKTVLTMETGESFAQIIGADAIVTVTGTGPFITRLSVTLPIDIRNGWIRNRPWSVLIAAYYQRDLLILAPQMP